MTDEESEISATEELEQRAEQSAQRAQMMHDQLSQYAEWAVDEAAEIRIRAQLLFENGELGEEELNRLEAMSVRIREIFERISDDG